MIRQKSAGPLVVDLTGADGNAFVLLALAKRLARQFQYSTERTSELLNRMMTGNYENLVQVLDDEFGDILILER